MNGVKVHQRLLTRTDNRPNRPFDGLPAYITVHETGNTATGATALNTAIWVNNGSPGANGVQKLSFHMVVDDIEAYQLLRDDEQGWHAGDGAGPGNTESIALEICVNKTGAARNKALDNGARIVAAWLDKGYGAKGVRQHNEWSGKNCPMYMRRGEPYGWLQFFVQVEKHRAAKPFPVAGPTPEQIREIVREMPIMELARLASDLHVGRPTQAQADEHGGADAARAVLMAAERDKGGVWPWARNLNAAIITERLAIRELAAIVGELGGDPAKVRRLAELLRQAAEILEE